MSKSSWVGYVNTWQQSTCQARISVCLTSSRNERGRRRRARKKNKQTTHHLRHVKSCNIKFRSYGQKAKHGFRACRVYGANENARRLKIHPFSLRALFAPRNKGENRENKWRVIPLETSDNRPNFIVVSRLLRKGAPGRFIMASGSFVG